jgi:hypothetical protein
MFAEMKSLLTLAPVAAHDKINYGVPLELRNNAKAQSQAVSGVR